MSCTHVSAGTLSEPWQSSIVVPSAKPSLPRHTARTLWTSYLGIAATTVLRPDSMVSLSR
eukprot:4144288-Amphidinium_carterae.1